jgi:dipeptidyl aminopeptidase/acylaminoacyl peptidase
MMELGTVPVFQQPATAIGVNRLAIVVNGNASSGQGEGEKFAWFGKTVELCGPVPVCSPVAAPSWSVTDDPTISPVDGSMAFVEASQCQTDLPPLYSSAASWEQVESWYASDALWILSVGSDSPVQADNTTGAVDPVFSEKGNGLVFVKDQALWLLPGPTSQPVEIAGPLQRPPAPYLFGYIDWPDEFAWWG